MIYERKQNDPARRGAGKGRAVGLGQTAGEKQQGKVSAVKGFDKEGNLQTVPPIQGGEFMQVDKNGDIISNLVANFYRKFQDTEGLALFRCKASEVEQNAKAMEGDKRTEALRVPKPDNPESKQGYRFDPAKIDWESLKKVGITADTLKNTKDFDRVMRGYKSRNTYTVSGTVGGFYLRPTDVKLSFYQAKDGTIVPKLHGVQQDEKLLQRPYNGHEFSKQEQGNLQHIGNLGSVVQITDPKSGGQIPVFISRDRYTHELEYMRADKWKCPESGQDGEPAIQGRDKAQCLPSSQCGGAWLGVPAKISRASLAAGTTAHATGSRSKG